MKNRSKIVISDDERAVRGAWRLEIKYRIDYFTYHKIRAALRPFMRRDHFTGAAPGFKYFVRSLYYDTHDYSAYHEKMAGDSERIKFRIRTYSETYDENAVIRAEMKVRKGNSMEKYSSFISLSEYEYFMKKKNWPEEDNPVLNEFARYVRLRSLDPKVLIEYFREGYHDRAGSDLRITFDHRVKSAHSDRLFAAGKKFYREHIPHNVVLEIKSGKERPAWVRDLVRDYGLKWVANSKFTQGIQASRRDLFHPAGVVLIR